MELSRDRDIRAEGFTAIETLIALLILAIGVMAVSTGFTEGRRVATEADRRQQAVRSAQDKLSEKLALGYDKVAQTSDVGEHMEGDTVVGDDAHNGITRRWWIETDWAVPGFTRVVVVTQWTRRGERQTYQVAGLLARGRTE